MGSFLYEDQTAHARMLRGREQIQLAVQDKKTGQAIVLRQAIAGPLMATELGPWILKYSGNGQNGACRTRHYEPYTSTTC